MHREYIPCFNYKGHHQINTKPSLGGCLGATTAMNRNDKVKVAYSM